MKTIMDVKRTFDLIQWNVEKYPREDMYGGRKDKEWKTYSTEDVNNYVNWVSYGLLSLGYIKGDKVATICGNKPEWNFIDLGLAQAGLIHIPIYPTISTEEYSYILNNSATKIIILSNKLMYNKVRPISGEIDNLDIFSIDKIDGVRSFDEIIEAGKRNADKFHDILEEIKESIKPEDLVSIIYTSGTTGNPKGVMLSHKNLISNAISTANAYDLGYGDRAISFLPLCHVYERMMNYNFQYKGISTYYVENMGTITEAMKEVKPQIFNTVPRLLEKIYDNILSKGSNLTWIKKKIFFWAVALGLKYRLKGNSSFYKFRLGIARKLVFNKWKEALGGELKIIVAGGAALQPRLERIFWASGICISQGYGLTETSPVIAVNPPFKDKARFGTVGPILENIEVKIADDGEILCRGENVMMGYYKAPELTAEAIDKDGFFHTGDIGVLEDGKFLRITDRKKEMFKLSAGKYIAPQVIENKLKESLFIEQVMVIGENEKFASALISPNFSYLHDWCSLNKIQFRDNIDLIEQPEVIEKFAKEVKEVNQSLGEYEQIKRFRLVTEEWSPQTGELSQTLKLKRNFISKKYKEIISEIYFTTGKETNMLVKIKKSIKRITNISEILKNLPKF
ncbi:MAG: long-chain fatty acid--CoA ligase [Bacteroidales bacterium]|nr:long-chain fatty acid--CoA ligase [Bacteroidales bacterium]